MPPWLELVRVQLPGREDRLSEEPASRTETVIPALMQEVETLLDQPLAVYGHCMGALLAFELAREMRRRQHKDPMGLFVSGRRPPQGPVVPPLFKLDEPSLLSALEAMGASSPLLTNERWRQYYIGGVRSDLEIADTYVYREEAPLNCPISLFIGRDDPCPTIEGWSCQTSGRFDEIALDGGHFFSSEGVRYLIAAIGHSVSGHLDAANVGRAGSSISMR
ncbi:thioesterase (plasmid) [Candidatus Burkholderia crenata]|nr:thioesterase [Candidatus Burkholderia crenata]